MVFDGAGEPLFVPAPLLDVADGPGKERQPTGPGRQLTGAGKLCCTYRRRRAEGGGQTTGQGVSVHRRIVAQTLIGQAQQKLLAGSEMSQLHVCLLYTSPSPRDGLLSRM